MRQGHAPRRTSPLAGRLAYLSRALVIRPGPPWIDRNAAPGGVVVHVYAAADPPELIIARRLYPHDPAIEAHGDEDGNMVAAVIAAGHGAVVLVVYDGDTGERLPPPVSNG